MSFRMRVNAFARLYAVPFNRRNMSTSPLNRPSPPPLPPKEQREFEELVRAAATPAAFNVSDDTAVAQVRVEKGNELHPDARRTPPPEFEGDTNPLTGEVGGPKREPVRHGDWSFGGRASDF